MLGLRDKTARHSQSFSPIPIWSVKRYDALIYPRESFTSRFPRFAVRIRKGKKWPKKIFKCLFFCSLPSFPSAATAVPLLFRIFPSSSHLPGRYMNISNHESSLLGAGKKKKRDPTGFLSFLFVCVSYRRPPSLFEPIWTFILKVVCYSFTPLACKYLSNLKNRVKSRNRMSLRMISIKDDISGIVFCRLPSRTPEQTSVTRFA